MKVLQVKIKLTTPNSKQPKKNSSSYILFSAEDVTILPQSKGLVNMGITMAIPQGYYGQAFATEHIGDIKLLGGVIMVDSDYRGELRAIVFNATNKEHMIKAGDPLCGIVFVKIWCGDLDVVDDLEGSERGGSGFGSTGK